MICVKRKKGYKIKLETGRIFPKVYPTLSACRGRIDQMKRHSSLQTNTKKRH